MTQIETPIPEETQTALKAMARNIQVNLTNMLNTTKSIHAKHLEDHEGVWPIDKQYLKLYEEMGEAEKAYSRNLTNQNMEHMDVMFAFITLMHFKNLNADDLYLAILECLTKFHRRGWI